jgi:phage shock protein PspC (stress-responsive transcriptional regulator)
MSEQNRNNDWQMIAAVALIVVGGIMFLNQIGGPWWEFARRAFRFAFDVAWPLAIVALGVLLLLGAKRGGFAAIDVRGKRLYRSRSDRMVAGVLGGLASYLGVDPTWVRIVYVALAIAGIFPLFVVYIIALIVIPEEPKNAPAPVEWQTAAHPVPPSASTVPPVSQDPPPPPPPAAG